MLTSALPLCGLNRCPQDRRAYYSALIRQVACRSPKDRCLQTVFSLPGRAGTALRPLRACQTVKALVGTRGIEPPFSPRAALTSENGRPHGIPDPDRCSHVKPVFPGCQTEKTASWLAVATAITACRLRGIVQDFLTHPTIP